MQLYIPMVIERKGGGRICYCYLCKMQAQPSHDTNRRRGVEQRGGERE